MSGGPNPADIPTTAEQVEMIDIIDAKAANLVNPDPRLKKSLENADAAGLPQIGISDQQGQLLSVLCQFVNAKNVLELGACGGYSTIWLARSGAHVTSVEMDPKARDITLKNTHGQGLENVNVILGSTLEVLPKLASEGRKFDLVFVDAGWDEQFENFELAVKLTRKGGAIIVDNVIAAMFFGGNKEKEKKEDPFAGEGILEKVGKTKNVDATLVKTIANYKNIFKGVMDGFILATVTE